MVIYELFSFEGLPQPNSMDYHSSLPYQDSDQMRERDNSDHEDQEVNNRQAVKRPGWIWNKTTIYGTDVDEIQVETSLRSFRKYLII